MLQNIRSEKKPLKQHQKNTEIPNSTPPGLDGRVCTGRFSESVIYACHSGESSGKKGPTADC